MSKSKKKAKKAVRIHKDITVYLSTDKAVRKFSNKHKMTMSDIYENGALALIAQYEANYNKEDDEAFKDL